VNRQRPILSGPHSPRTVADIEGVTPALPSLFGRRTDAVTVLLISENGSVLWRRHRQLIYKQVTATHQSFSLFIHVLQR